jgi:hypothetical protein
MTNAGERRVGMASERWVRERTGRVAREASLVLCAGTGGSAGRATPSRAWRASLVD